jgi:hypothetical protein
VIRAGMIVTGRLRRLRKQPDRRRIATNIGKGKCSAEFHYVLSNKHVQILYENEPSP